MIRRTRGVILPLYFAHMSLNVHTWWWGTLWCPHQEGHRAAGVDPERATKKIRGL